MANDILVTGGDVRQHACKALAAAGYVAEHGAGKYSAMTTLPRLTCVNTNGQLRAMLEAGAAIRRRD